MTFSIIDNYLIFPNKQLSNKISDKTDFQIKLNEMSEAKSTERVRQIFKEALTFANNDELLQLWTICKTNKIMPQFEQKDLDVFSASFNGGNFFEAHRFFTQIHWQPSIETACFSLEICLFKLKNSNKQIDKNFFIKTIEILLQDYNAFSLSTSSSELIKAHFSEQIFSKLQSNIERQHLSDNLNSRVLSKKNTKTKKRL